MFWRRFLCCPSRERTGLHARWLSQR